MIALEQIVQKVISDFQVIIIGLYDTQKHISNVELLTSQTILDLDTLYLCDNISLLTANLSFPNQEDNLSNYCLLTSCRETLPFSTIIMNQSISVYDLYLTIRTFLKMELLLLTQTDLLYKKLYQGKGLKGIVETAETFLSYPISVCDASYNLLETSSMMKKIAYGLEHSKQKTYLTTAEVESMKRFHIIEQIYKSNTAFSIRTPDHVDNCWVFCGIRIQNVLTGYVAVCMKDADATDYQLRITNIIANICSLEMQKHDFFMTKTGLKYENFLIDLLEGAFHDINLISTRLNLLDRKFCKYFCIIIFTCTEPHDSDLFNKQQMTKLRSVFPNSMSVVYDDSIVLFINQETPIHIDDTFLTQLFDFANLNHMKVGISQPFTDILKIKAYYRQSVQTLALGEYDSTANVLYNASDLLPQYLFYNADTTGLEVGIHYLIYQLMSYDQEYHTEFVLTLRTYLENDRNASKSAQALHIHRSTFFYRIKKIEELLNISITDSKLLFLFELSFKIWDYLCVRF